MPGLVAGLRHSGPTSAPINTGMLSLGASTIQPVSVNDLRKSSPAVFAQLDRLDRLTEKIYIHIDKDVLDPSEVIGHQNKVPDGPSSLELAARFEPIFRRYPKASTIGFATIPASDPGGSPSQRSIG